MNIRSAGLNRPCKNGMDDLDCRGGVIHLDDTPHRVTRGLRDNRLPRFRTLRHRTTGRPALHWRALGFDDLCHLLRCQQSEVNHRPPQRMPGVLLRLESRVELLLRQTPALEEKGVQLEIIKDRKST